MNKKKQVIYNLDGSYSIKTDEDSSSGQKISKKPTIEMNVYNDVVAAPTKRKRRAKSDVAVELETTKTNSDTLDSSKIVSEAEQTSEPYNSHVTDVSNSIAKAAFSSNSVYQQHPITELNELNLNEECKHENKEIEMKPLKQSNKKVRILNLQESNFATSVKESHTQEPEDSAPVQKAFNNTANTFCKISELPIPTDDLLRSLCSVQTSHIIYFISLDTSRKMLLPSTNSVEIAGVRIINNSIFMIVFAEDKMSVIKFNKEAKTLSDTDATLSNNNVVYVNEQALCNLSLLHSYKLDS